MKVPLRIAQLAGNVERVPPVAYGGTELVVHTLTEELVARGHAVTLFATGDSLTTAKLVSTVTKPLRTDETRKQTQWAAYDMASCLRLLELKDEFDLVHNHLGYHALPFLAQLALPVVTTIHNPIKEYCRDIFLAYRHLPFVSISESFRALNLPDRLNYIGCVYNGIDTDAFANVPKVSREYLLFVGRISNDKGTAEAIDIAKALGLPIKIAGKIDSNDATYFANQIKPRLEAYERAEYVGEVNHDQKRVLYAGARAVVYPINFDEPFGLVMAESLASGTPVMACDRGSVREIIVDCETGIIGKTKENLINRYSEIASISSENCVRRVSECFSVKKMVDGYENIYRLLAETDSESKEPFEMTLSLQ